LQDVRDTENGSAEVVLSRSDPEFVRQLFIQEVPEITDGTVVIDRIVRDPGYRTKLTVRTTDPKVDPVGACVGMRGLRVKNVVRELNHEKIDIIPYSSDPIELLQNALQPIEIVKFSMNEDEKQMTIVVVDDDFPVVIGKRGMNATLNGELIGYDLEVQKVTDYNKAMAVQRIELADMNDPKLDEELTSIPGVSSLIFETLVTEGFSTPRKILQATQAQLSEVSGISAELADRILEQIQKQILSSIETEEAAKAPEEVSSTSENEE